MRLRTTILPALALAGALFATWSVLGQAGVPPRIDPPGAPPVNPYRGAIAGLGAVEPASQVVAVASELSGVIVAVHVQAGDTVAAGAPLLALDDRTYRAALASAVAEIAARANIAPRDVHLVQMKGAIPSTTPAEERAAEAAGLPLRSNMVWSSWRIPMLG